MAVLVANTLHLAPSTRHQHPSESAAESLSAKDAEQSSRAGVKSAVIPSMRTCAAALGITALVASALGARAPAASTQTQPSPPSDGSTVTVTGCLRAAEPPGTFVLEKVTWRPTDGPSKDGLAHHDAPPQRDRPTIPATAAERETPAAGATLRLAGAATRLKMGDHVGHTVTVTGILAPQDPIVRPAIVLPDQPVGDTTSRTVQGEDKKSPRVLNVRSFTHVEGSCR